MIGNAQRHANMGQGRNTANSMTPSWPALGEVARPTPVLLEYGVISSPESLHMSQVWGGPAQDLLAYVDPEGLNPQPYA